MRVLVDEVEILGGGAAQEAEIRLEGRRRDFGHDGVL